MSAGAWRLQANTCRDPGSFRGWGENMKRLLVEHLATATKQAEKAKIKVRYWETKNEGLGQVNSPRFRGRLPLDSLLEPSVKCGRGWSNGTSCGWGLHT